MGAPRDPVGLPRLSRRGFSALGVGLLLDTLLSPTRSLAAVAELAVIVHPSNGVKVSGDDIADIFRTIMRSWPGGRPIAAFELPPNSEERVFFDRAVLKMDPDDVAHFWIDRRMRGGAPPPHQVPEPAILARVVAKLENAIGYVPTPLADASVRTVARVRAGGIVVATSPLEGGRATL